ncbi:MAG: GldG family protein [Firmicutes bacterium]|nr:GldG family protein [Bacillota bacterium]
MAVRRQLDAAAGIAGALLVLAALLYYGIMAAAPVWLYGMAALGVVLLVYYVAVNGRALWRFLSGRTFRYGSHALLLTVAVLGIVVLANVVVARHPWRLDTTRNKLYTLSPQTVQVLRGLQQDVTITAFFKSGTDQEQMVRNLLKEYSYQTRHLKVRFVDPVKEPALARQYQISTDGTSVVANGPRTKTVYPYDVFNYSYDAYGQPQSQFQGEQAFTRAILDVTAGKQRLAYFTSGHGERSPDRDYSRAEGFLTGEGYTVKTVNIAQDGKIPADAALLIIAGPSRDFTPQETAQLTAYLNQGGKMLVLLDPTLQKGTLSNLDGFLAQWGVRPDHDVVVDPARHYFVDAVSPIPVYEDHDITRKLMEDNLGIVLPQSRSLSQASPVPAGLSVAALLKTSDQAWGETNLQQKQAKFDAADLKGPLTLAYAVTKDVQPPSNAGSKGAPKAQSQAKAPGAETAQARLVVVGNAAFLDNDVLTFQGNVDFFMNAANWLTGKQSMITIRPKTAEFAQVYLSGTQAKTLFYGLVLILPLLFLLAGGVVFWRRRAL